METLAMTEVTRQHRLFRQPPRQQPSRRARGAASTPPMPQHPPPPGADTEEPESVDEPDLPTQQPVEPDIGKPPREGEV
jgi:hypothetical protein